jgi:hypothetical protein
MKTISIVLGILLLIGSASDSAFAQKKGGLKDRVAKVKGKIKELDKPKEKAKETPKETPKGVTEDVYTPFQKENIGKILFIGKEEVDVDQVNETAADFVTEVELGAPLCIRTYFKGGDYNQEKEGNMRLDVRYTVDGISFTNYDLTKYAYKLIESTPGQNTFGNFRKFENFMPINSITGIKIKNILTATLVAPRGQYWANLVAPEDAFRFFVATKLKSYMVPGKTFTLKVELYKTSENYYHPNRDAARVIGEVYAVGEIKIKVTDLLKKTDNVFYRMFTEGLVDKAAADGAAKQIATKFPSTVSKVHKVFFIDNDYRVTMGGGGVPINRIIKALVYFENPDGYFFVTETRLTYLYQGGAYSNTPELMEGGQSGITFPVVGAAAGK